MAQVTLRAQCHRESLVASEHARSGMAQLQQVWAALMPMDLLSMSVAEGTPRAWTQLGFRSDDGAPETELGKLNR
jgi:hypothetical protein